MRLLATILLLLFSCSVEAKTESVEDRQQKFAPIVQADKTIFIDSRASKEGNGTFERPFKTFNSAAREINKQEKKNVVFLHGVPKEGFNFKEMQVFGPKTPVVIAMEKKGKKTLKVIDAREKESVKLERIQSDATILGFNHDVNTRPIRTVVRTVVKEVPQSHTDSKSKHPEKLEKSKSKKSSFAEEVLKQNLYKNLRKLSSSKTYHPASASSHSSPTRTRPSAPIPGPSLPPSPALAPPPPIVLPVPMPSSRPASSSPGGTPPPLPGGGAASSSGGVPPPPPVLKPAQAATNGAIRKFGGHNFTTAKGLESHLESVDVDSDTHQNLRDIELANLFHFLQAVIERNNLQHDQAIANAVKTFSIFVKNHTSQWSIEKLHRRVDLVYKATRKLGQPLGGFITPDLSREVGVPNIGINHFPSIFENLDPALFGGTVKKPYTLLHYIFGFKPYKKSVALAAPSSSPSANPIPLIPDEGVVEQFLEKYDKILQDVNTKNYKSFFYKISKGTTSSFISVDQLMIKTIPKGKPKPTTEPGWNPDYVRAYQGLYQDVYLASALAQALRGILNYTATNWKNKEQEILKRINQVQQYRKSLVNGHLALHGHPKLPGGVLPVHHPDGPLPIPHGHPGAKVPAMPERIKKQYQALTEQENNLHQSLIENAQNTHRYMMEIKSNADADPYLKGLFHPIPAPNHIVHYDVPNEVILRVAQAVIASHEGQQKLHQIQTLPPK